MKLFSIIIVYASSAFLYIVLILALSSCGNKCERLFSKNPDCFVISSDTVTIFDTTITERVTLDTSFILSGTADTFFVTIDKVKTRIIRHTDTLLINQAINPDTIIREKTIITGNKIVKEKSTGIHPLVFFALAAVCVLLLTALIKWR
jgi:hypothetical protein